MAGHTPSICKSCGKLMGTASECPYCGARRGSPVGLVKSWARNLHDDATSLTYVLIAICWGFFGLTMAVSALFQGPAGIVQALMSPSSEVLLFMGLNGPFVFQGYWWGIFTSLFLHIGIFHIIFNMYALSILGPLVERNMPRSMFWILFVLSGASGALLTAFMGNSAAGASGSIMGLLGSGLSYAYLRGRGWDDPEVQELLKWAGMIFIFGIVINQFSSVRIDNWGHFGGLVVGAGLTAIWVPFRNNPLFKRTVSPAIGWLLVGLVVVSYLSCWFHFY